MSQSPYSNTLHLRKDGLPDRRFNTSKDIGDLHFTKNGQLDRRFKSTELYEKALSMNNLPQPNFSNANARNNAPKHSTSNTNARIISSGPQTTIANSRILALGPHPYSAKNIEALKKYFLLKTQLNGLIPIGFSNFSYDQQFPYDINFSLILVNSSQNKSSPNPDKLVKELISLSGFEIEGERVIINEITPEITGERRLEKIRDIFNHMYDQNDYILEKLFENFNGILNLSNFNDQFHIKLNFNEKGILNFVLFMCAKHSSLTGKDVRIINFKNNNLRSLISFLPSKKIFPNLETIIIEGNTISDNSFIFNEITETGVSIQQSTGGFTNFNLVKDPLNIVSSIEENPPQLETNKNEESTIEIFPSEFFANPFLIEFLKQSKEDMSHIYYFYTDTAIMSLTAEISTDLIPYKEFTRSLKSGRNNYVQGPEEINEFCLAVFGNSVEFKITKIQANEIIENRYLMVLHGYFINEIDATIGFDRTILIGLYDDTFMISNDQIHLRSTDQ